MTNIRKRKMQMKMKINCLASVLSRQLMNHQRKDEATESESKRSQKQLLERAMQQWKVIHLNSNLSKA